VNGRDEPGHDGPWLSKNVFRSFNARVACGFFRAKNFKPDLPEIAMPQEPIELSEAEIEQAKLLYDAGITPIPEFLRLFNMSERRFLKFRRENGWPLRPSPCLPRAGREIDSVRPLSSEKSARALIARLEEAVEREFGRAESALTRPAPKTIETRARTLASLVKSLAELKRMSRDAQFDTDAAEEEGERNGADDRNFDSSPRELAELRAELARRLERLRGDGQAG
jgi:hypothetical protein